MAADTAARADDAPTFDDLREREAATREILQVISRSRDDEGPVFETILRNAARLCHAPMAGLNLANEAGTHLRLVAHHGPPLRSFAAGETLWPLDSAISLAVAARERRAVQIDDLKDSDLYRAGDPIRVRSVDEEGLRTFLAVPLLGGPGVIGCIALYRREVKPFSDHDIALLETFAEQAVIAIENVRQFRELQARLAREAATGEVLGVISRSRDDDRPVFETILENAQALCDAPISGLILADPDDPHQTLAAHRGMSDATVAMFRERRMPMDGGVSYAARCILEGRLIAFADMAESDLYAAGSPVVRAMVDVVGIRSVLFVPLMRGDAAIGCVTLFRCAVQPFEDRAVDLVKTFAAQAVIAIENVRQFRALQTRLEREAATREILEVISRSRDDERPVFDAILKNASRLCHAPLAYLSMANEARTHATIPACRGARPDFAEALTRFREPIEGARLVAVRPIAEQQVIRQDDIADDDLYREREPNRVNMVEQEGARSILAVPLISGEQGVGAIVLYRREVAPFTDDDVALVEAFAAQAVIAIENVRQFRELQARLEREAASREILQVISENRADEAPVFDVILKTLMRLCDAPQAALYLLSGDCQFLELAAGHGDGRADLDRIRRDNPIAVADDTNSTFVQTYRARKPLLFDDLKTDLPWRDDEAELRAAVEKANIRSALLVPLLNGETCIGVLTAYRQQVAPFDTDDIALVETFAAQAVIAIENVRQFRELQARLEREAATRAILQVINRSAQDETPVFDAILSNAARLCRASRARMQLVDEGREAFVLVASWGGDLKSFRLGDRLPLDSDLAVPTSIRQARTVHVADLAQDAAYLARDPVRVRLVEEEGLRTLLAVPLVKDGAALGSITLSRSAPEPFAEADIALVETFAAQAVIALENVRQFREVQERLERERATREILEVISRSRSDDAPVFDLILRKAAELCGAHAAALAFGRRGDPHQRLVASYGVEAETIRVYERGEVSMNPEISLAAKAILSGEVVHVEDMAETEGYRQGVSHYLTVVNDTGIRTNLFVPLLSGEGGIGAMILFRKEVRPYTADEIALVETFAAQAVIAIENVRQFRALEASNEEVRAQAEELQSLNAGLETRVAAQVGEIERMGRLKRFLSPAVADAVVTSGDDRLLSSHRALIAVLFADIRGFTAFCERAEPEETIEVLQTYHEAMGALIAAHGAGVDHRSGDGIMAIFNDPLPCDDPAGDALRMALAMRARMESLCAGWRKLGHRLGFGVGIALGYATVGMVGSEGRYDYTASGTVVNLAARLCEEAGDGDILLSPRAWLAVEDRVEAEPFGALALKGIADPVEAMRVIGLRGAA